MNLKDKNFLLIIVLIFAGFLIYKIQDFLAPFILSFVIAYFLNPVVSFLHKKARMPRYLAAILVVMFFILVIIGIFLTIIPTIYGRTIDIIQLLPNYLTDLGASFYPKIHEYLSRYGIESSIGKSSLSLFQDLRWLSKAEDILLGIFTKTFESTSAIIGLLSFVFLVPIIVFYLLKDWEAMLKHISCHIPISLEKQIKEIFLAIDKVLAGYARGQLNVCIILALFYGISLAFCQLNSGFAIGMITGILAFIPYIGFGIGVIFAFLSAALQWGLDSGHMLTIAAIFVFGQVIESNFLVPFLIGKKVGIHPLWLIFGLFFFGSLFGFLGIALAVPLTAVFSVVVKYLLRLSHKI